MPKKKYEATSVATILMFLAISAVTACKVAPKNLRVAEDPWPGSVSSDGRYIAYVGDVDGDDHVFLRDLKTGQSRRLTEGPGESGEFPIISPDVTHIAYDWVVGDGDAVWELRIMAVDGSSPRVVYRANGLLLLQPRGWSADGQHILADLLQKGGNYQLVLVSVGDGSVRVVKTLPLQTLNGRKPYNAVKLSPDGRHVAYEFPPHGDSPDRQIFVVSTDSGNETPLLQHRSRDRLLDWTPDGEGILFASDRAGTWGFWAVPVHDGKRRGAPEQVKANVGLIDKGLGFTADGSYYYAVSAWENSVYLAAIDPRTGELGNPQALVPDVGWRTSVEWSPDGRNLAYVYGHGHQPDPFAVGIRSIESGEERRLPIHRLTRFGYHEFQAHWSPDGRWLVAVGRDKDFVGPGMDSQGLYRIDAQSGGVTPIVRAKGLCWPDCLEWPAWSEGGELIYFRWLPPSIVARDIAGDQEREIYRVPEGGGWVSHLAVSPDGRHVAFVSRSAGLKVVAVGGGEPHELLKVETGNSISALAWTPDATQIIYAVNTGGEKQEFELRSVPAQGGEPKSLGLSMEGVMAHALSVHPDGHRIAFTAGTPLRSEVWMVKELLRASRNSRQEY